MKRILTICISLGLYISDQLLRLLRSLAGGKQPTTAVVLYYHSTPLEQRQAFARQMDHLLRCACPIAVDRRVSLGSATHYVSVTFDDGYQNVVENAVPELTKRGIPATIFVVPGALGQTPNWEDYSGGTDAAMHEPIMTEEQLRNLPSELVQIGSHTLSHPMLAQISENDARTELTNSRVMLEQIIGQEVNLLSFPYGSFDQRVISLCREEGYTRVFNSLPLLTFSRADEFVTGRVAVEPHDWWLEFHLKLHGAYRWLPKASSWKRSLTSRSRSRLQQEHSVRPA